MKNQFRKIKITIGVGLFAFTMHSQQIGNGLSNIISDFTVPVFSGTYNGFNAIGSISENEWQHLFVVRHPNPNNNYQLQIASTIAENDRLYFRKLASGVATAINPKWHELATRGKNNFIGDQTITGNVGIGTPNPSEKLEIYNSDTSPAVISLKSSRGDLQFVDVGRIMAKQADVEIARIGMPRSGDQFSGYLTFWTKAENNGNLTEKVRIAENGNVGIGTPNPSEKLEIYNSDTSPAVISLKSSRGDLQFVDVGRIMAKQADVEIARIGMPRSGDQFSGYLTFWTKAENNGNLTEKVRIAENGNVGIGTQRPTSKLTVAGDINSREVRVSVDAGADFVFEKDYNLPSLEFVDNYIKENKHLPQIASATEMQNNGINLSEMNIKLLQKIEELTLYTIEQNKKINELQKENRRFSDIEKRLAQLEKVKK